MTEQQQPIEIKASDEAVKGSYANMLQVAHTREEFVLSFMNVFPPVGVLTSRVFVTPAHMKRIVAALAENLKRYEQQFGEVELEPGGGEKTSTTTTSEHAFGFRTEESA